MFKLTFHILMFFNMNSCHVVLKKTWYLVKHNNHKRKPKQPKKFDGGHFSLKKIVPGNSSDLHQISIPCVCLLLFWFLMVKQVHIHFSPTHFLCLFWRNKTLVNLWQYYFPLHQTKETWNFRVEIRGCNCNVHLQIAI